MKASVSGAVLAVICFVVSGASCASGQKAVADPKACTKNAECAAKEYCRMDHACGGQGSCETMPEICTEQYDPVVACNGKTYGNACRAHASGASVKERANTK